MDTIKPESLESLGSLEPLVSLHPGGLELTEYAAVQAGIRSGWKVLDVGCGTGSSLIMMREKFDILPFGVDASSKAVSYYASSEALSCYASSEAASYDASSEAISYDPDPMEAFESSDMDASTVIAKGSVHTSRPALSKAIELKTGDASNLPYEDNFFDAVMMECVITLLEHPEEALGEAVRVLRPGGKLIITALADRAASAGAAAGTTNAEAGEKANATADVTANAEAAGTDDPYKQQAAGTDDPCCKNGLLNTDVLYSLLAQLGCELLYEEDRKQDLIQYIADSIFQYGSIEARIAEETARVGTTVLDCKMDRRSKTITYMLSIFEKAEAPDGQ